MSSSLGHNISLLLMTKSTQRTFRRVTQAMNFGNLELSQIFHYFHLHWGTLFHCTWWPYQQRWCPNEFRMWVIFGNSSILAIIYLNHIRQGTPFHCILWLSQHRGSSNELHRWRIREFRNFSKYSLISSSLGHTCFTAFDDRINTDDLQMSYAGGWNSELRNLANIHYFYLRGGTPFSLHWKPYQQR